MTRDMGPHFILSYSALSNCNLLVPWTRWHDRAHVNYYNGNLRAGRTLTSERERLKPTICTLNAKFGLCYVFKSNGHGHIVPHFIYTAHGIPSVIPGHQRPIRLERHPGIGGAEGWDMLSNPEWWMQDCFKFYFHQGGVIRYHNGNNKKKM